MEKFFIYASLYPNFIKLNESNPVIIDFYHDYYLYLLKNEDKKEANEIIKKLYDKQKDFKAFIRKIKT